MIFSSSMYQILCQFKTLREHFQMVCLHFDKMLSLTDDRILFWIFSSEASILIHLYVFVFSKMD